MNLNIFLVWNLNFSIADFFWVGVKFYKHHVMQLNKNIHKWVSWFMKISVERLLQNNFFIYDFACMTLKICFLMGHTTNFANILVFLCEN